MYLMCTDLRSEPKTKFSPSKMGRGCALATEKRAEVIALHERGKLVPKIVNRTNSSTNAVRRVLQNGQVRSREHKTGMKSKIMALALRLIIHQASAGRFTARNLRDAHNKDVTLLLLHQIISAAPELR